MLRQFQIIQLFTVAMLTFYVIGVVGCGSSSAATSAQPSGGSLQIAETDSGFEPKSITVDRGQALNVTFANKGKMMHNLRIGSGGQFMGPNDVTFGNPIVQPGQSASGLWTAPSEAGKVLFRCDVHPNHTGTITVR